MTSSHRPLPNCSSVGPFSTKSRPCYWIGKFAFSKYFCGMKGAKCKHHTWYMKCHIEYFGWRGACFLSMLSAEDLAMQSLHSQSSCHAVLDWPWLCLSVEQEWNLASKPLNWLQIPSHTNVYARNQQLLQIYWSTWQIHVLTGNKSWVDTLLHY